MPAPGPLNVDSKVPRSKPPDGPESTLPYLEMALTQGDEAWIDEIARAINTPEDSAGRPEARQESDVSGLPVVTTLTEDAEHVEPAPIVDDPVPETPVSFSAPPLVTTPAAPEPHSRAESTEVEEVPPGRPSRAGTWRTVALALGLLAVVATLFVLYLRSRGADPAGAIATAGAAEPGSRTRDVGNAQPAPTAPAATAATGRLVLGYTGTRVFVDGAQDSRSPVATYELSPGDHEVRLQTPAGTVRRRVRITAGQETWLPLDVAEGTAAPARATTAPTTGWLRVSAPMEMQMFEGERFLGTTRVDRMLIEAGTHDVTLVAEGIGYRETHRVSVKPGATTSLGVTLPPGRLSVNAVPWANVFIDGQPAGETPIGNLEVSSGPHEIRLVHPALGEVTRTLVVKVGEPARLGVDLRKK
jgi:hypothetical protein